MASPSHQRRKRQPTPVILPGKFGGLRSLVDYSPWGRKESDMTEQFHFTSLQSLPSGSFHSLLSSYIRGKIEWNHNQRQLTKLITWITALSNSMKLWAILCRATQDGRVMVDSSDKKWSIGEGNGKPLQYSCLENPMNSMKRQKDMTVKDKLPRSVGAQYATGEERRYNSRKNEGTEPKWKQHPAVNMTGDGSEVQCYKKQYCIGTWNVRSMNQGTLEVVKQETARVNKCTSTF